MDRLANVVQLHQRRLEQANPAPVNEEQKEAEATLEDVDGNLMRIHSAWILGTNAAEEARMDLHNVPILENERDDFVSSLSKAVAFFQAAIRFAQGVRFENGIAVQSDD